MPATDVYDALSTLDDFMLNEDQIQKVCLMIPEPDLVKQLEDNRAAADELSKEEQYLLEIIKLPGIKGHLQSAEIKFAFSERFLAMNKNLQALKKAVVGIEDNPELKNVIVMVLRIGNYLNQGSNKGNVNSFNIELLDGLKGSKAVG